MKITAHTEAGRVLLALRAGKITPAQLKDRIPSALSLTTALIGRGLVGKTGRHQEDCYFLTLAGRAACPTRRKATKEAECAWPAPPAARCPASTR